MPCEFSLFLLGMSFKIVFILYYMLKKTQKTTYIRHLNKHIKPFFLKIWYLNFITSETIELSIVSLWCLILVIFLLCWFFLIFLLEKTNFHIKK